MRRIRKISARITGIHGAFSKKGKLVRYEADPLDGSVSATSTILTEDHNLSSKENHALDHTPLSHPISQQLVDKNETSMNQQHDSEEACSSLRRLWKLVFLGSLCSFVFLVLNNVNKASSKAGKLREELHARKDTLAITDNDYAQRDLANPTTMHDHQDPLESTDEIVQSLVSNYTHACDSQNWDLFRVSFTEDATTVYYETTGGVQHGGNVKDNTDFFTSKSLREEQQKDLLQKMLGIKLPTTYKHEHYITIVEDNNGDDNNDTIWLIHSNNTDGNAIHANTLVFHGTFVFVEGIHKHELVKVVDDSGGGIRAWKSKMTHESFHYHTLEYLRKSLVISVVYVLYSIIFKMRVMLLNKKKNKKKTPKGEMTKNDHETSCRVTTPLNEVKERKQSHNEDIVQEREEEMSGDDMTKTVEIPLVTPFTPTPSLENKKMTANPTSTSSSSTRSSRPYETDKIKELRLRRLRSQQVLSNRLQSVSSVTSSPISTTSTCMSSITTTSFRTREEYPTGNKNTAPNNSMIEWKARIADPPKSAAYIHEEKIQEDMGTTIQKELFSSLETPVFGFV